MPVLQKPINFWRSDSISYCNYHFCLLVDLNFNDYLVRTRVRKNADSTQSCFVWSRNGYLTKIKANFKHFPQVERNSPRTGITIEREYFGVLFGMCFISITTLGGEGAKWCTFWQEGEHCGSDYLYSLVRSPIQLYEALKTVVCE